MTKVIGITTEQIGLVIKEFQAKKAVMIGWTLF